MPIEIISTTDTPEQVTAAKEASEAKVKGVEETAVEETLTETLEASEPSEQSEGEGETDPKKEGEEPEKKPKKKSSFQRRVNRLNAKVSAAEQERDYWRAQATKAQSPKPEQTPPKNETTSSGKPDPNKFENHDDYLEALTDWKVEMRLKAEEKTRSEQRAQSEENSKAKTYGDKVRAFAKDHPDFQEAMEEIDHIPMSLTVKQTLLNSENGVELAYQLAKHPEEYQKICEIKNAVDAARALGKFEAKYLDRPADPPKQEVKTTKAPTPIKPVGSKTTGKLEFREGMSFPEYEAWRLQNLRSRGRHV